LPSHYYTITLSLYVQSAARGTGDGEVERGRSGRPSEAVASRARGR